MINPLSELQGPFTEIDQAFFLNFGQFYEPVLNPQENSILLKTSLLNFSQTLTVEIQNQLNFYHVKKSPENTLSKELILTNPLSLDFFDLLKSKILGENGKKVSDNECKQNFEEIFGEASLNSPDLLVKDIYGPSSTSIGLPENLLASSFGKMAQQKVQSFDRKQILRSLIMSIAINTGQISGLLSKKHEIKDVVIRKNRLNSAAFNKYFSTILKYSHPDARLYLKLTP